MRKSEYDFLTWKSFPSSIKLVSDEEWLGGWWEVFRNIPVTPGSKVRAEIMGKSDNVPTPLPPPSERMLGSYLVIYGSEDGATYRSLGFLVPSGGVYGKTDWTKHSVEMIIPPDVKLIRGALVAAKGETWFDDLKIYQDDILIYENQFTDWAPIIGATAGAILGGVVGGTYSPIGPLASPLLGVALGGAIGAGIGALASQPATTL